MTDSMFAAPGRFFRGNLHTHSDRSDGALSAEEVCRRYKAQGYDFIAITDHFVGLFDYPITDTSPYRDNQFTTILGAELHSGAMRNGQIRSDAKARTPVSSTTPREEASAKPAPGPT